MIYIKSPLRITLGGGGSDLPWFYKKNGGYVLTTSIDKFIHLFGIKRVYDNKIWLSYSKNEITENINNIKNEIIREALRYFNIDRSLELHTLSDVPGNSGLGSSGAFISTILKFCSEHKSHSLSKYELAKLGCYLEMTKLKKNSGLQDQFISVYGGIIEMFINTKGEVKVKKLKLKKKIKKKFLTSSVTFYTKLTRPSELVLRSQKKNYLKDIDKEKSMFEIIKIGKEIKKKLIVADIKGIGGLFHDHWQIKKNLANNMSNEFINNLYEYGIKCGAYGGKVIGAGGGGYIMFIIEPKKRKEFISKFKKFNLPILNWKFSENGTSLIDNSSK